VFLVGKTVIFKKSFPEQRFYIEVMGILAHFAHTHCFVSRAYAGNHKGLDSGVLLCTVANHQQEGFLV